MFHLGKQKSEIGSMRKLRLKASSGRKRLVLNIGRSYLGRPMPDVLLRRFRQIPSASARFFHGEHGAYADDGSLARGRVGPGNFTPSRPQIRT